MSMEVNGIYKGYKNDYPERLQGGGDEAKEAGSGKDTEEKRESIQFPRDEYVSSGKSGNRPSGLYHMGRDENGSPKVLYDDPGKRDSAEGSGKPGVKGNGSGKDEKVTSNTDVVDKEIEKLKGQKQQLEQQIREACNDEEKVRELEKKLSRVERELSQKDNDAYRRQHAVLRRQSRDDY